MHRWGVAVRAIATRSLHRQRGRSVRLPERATSAVTASAGPPTGPARGRSWRPLSRGRTRNVRRVALHEREVDPVAEHLGATAGRVREIGATEAALYPRS